MPTKRSASGKCRGTDACTHIAAHAYKRRALTVRGRDASWESDPSPGDGCIGEQMILRTDPVTAPWTTNLRDAER